VVDKALLATKVAAIRDAVARIRAMLPSEPAAFVSDRTAREVVVLNLFVALQEALALATHWLADEGRTVPQSYRDVMLALGEQAVVSPELAARLAAASGLRNLVAHQYGVLDWNRIYEVASLRLDDLLEFCESLSRAASA
jgi:uncharacterized protein YutE (UPF0331/DUF86 family)